MKLRAKAEIAREYRKAQRELRKLPAEAADAHAELRGSMQALAWALNDFAMAPVKAALWGRVPARAPEEPKR